MKDSLKVFLLYTVAGLLIAIPFYLNNLLITGRINKSVIGIKISEFNASALFIFLLIYLFYLARDIGRVISLRNDFLSRLFKLAVWIVSFIVVFNNKTFNKFLARLLNKLFDSLFDTYISQSKLLVYIEYAEVSVFVLATLYFLYSFVISFKYYFENIFKSGSAK
jgi:hypothetical protein